MGGHIISIINSVQWFAKQKSCKPIFCFSSHILICLWMTKTPFTIQTNLTHVPLVVEQLKKRTSQIS